MVKATWMLWFEFWFIWTKVKQFHYTGRLADIVNYAETEREMFPVFILQVMKMMLFSQGEDVNIVYERKWNGKWRKISLERVKTQIEKYYNKLDEAELKARFKTWRKKKQ